MPNLETERTILRPFRTEDYSELKIMMSDQDVMQYTGFKEAQNEEKIRACLEKWIKELGELGVWCVREKQSDTFVGWFMLKKTDYEFPELGFMLSKPQWAKGFATEVSRELIRYAFESLNYKKVIGITHRDNIASIGVLKKVGMEKESDIEEEGILFSVSKEKSCIT